MVLNVDTKNLNRSIASIMPRSPPPDIRLAKKARIGMRSLQALFSLIVLIILSRINVQNLLAIITPKNPIVQMYFYSCFGLVLSLFGLGIILFPLKWKIKKIVIIETILDLTMCIFCLVCFIALVAKQCPVGITVCTPYNFVITFTFFSLPVWIASLWFDVTALRVILFQI